MSKHIQAYPRFTKTHKDIQCKYKVPIGRPKSRAARVPGRLVRGPWLGPALGCRLAFCIYIVYLFMSRIYLDIF